jgi:hypothetical protein
MKRQKQKRREIIYDSLHDVRHKARRDRLPVFFIHCISSIVLNKLLPEL